MTKYVMKIKPVGEDIILLDRDVIMKAKDFEKDPKAYEIEKIRAVDASGNVWVDASYSTTVSDYVVKPKACKILEMV